MMCKPALTLSRERACHAKHSTLTLSSNGRLPGWTRLPRASRTEMPRRCMLPLRPSPRDSGGVSRGTPHRLVSRRRREPWMARSRCFSEDAIYCDRCGLQSTPSPSS